MDRDEFDRLVNYLRETIRFFKQPTEIRYEPTALEAYETWYRAYDKADAFADTPMAPFHARYQAYVHKLAMLHAASSAEDRISIESLGYATRTIEAITRSSLLLYDKYLALNAQDAEAKRILAFLPDDGQWVKRRDLIRKL